jgi:ribonuclease D
MDSTNFKTADFIQSESNLEVLGKKLRLSNMLGVDTESNSLYAYQEQVCLIQFSTHDEDFLVDPFPIQNLGALAPIFSDPGIEKIFHAAEYDLLCLRRDFGFETNNLFDTMVAARILGRKEVGLGAMLEAEFEVKLEKRFQRANWGQRPLTDAQLEYARMDTHFLIALRDKLVFELERRDLKALAKEDFMRLATNNREEAGNNHGSAQTKACWRINGAYDLKPQQVAVLQELCTYREDIARQLNRPLFKVLNDQTLVAIASTTPNNMEQLRKLPGMSNGQIRRHGHQLLRYVQRGLEAAPLHRPKTKRPDPRISDRLEVLQSWRKKAAAHMDVPSDVVLPRDLMKQIAHENPPNLDELGMIMKSVPWRMEHFGVQILRELRGLS